MLMSVVAGMSLCIITDYSTRKAFFLLRVDVKFHLLRFFPKLKDDQGGRRIQHANNGSG